MTELGWWLTVGSALLRRPGLWATAVRQAFRLAAPGWWRRRPFLPVPGAGYLHFRLVTQYGSAEHRIEPDDVLNYLAWCHRHDAAA